MPFDADDVAMFNDADMPGYVAALIGGVPVAGRFRKTYADVLGVGGSRPSFSAAIEALQAVVQGAAVEIDGTAYTVAEVQVAPEGLPDLTRLLLQRT